MERLMYILFEFGYVLVFGILGSITLFLQTNQEKGMEYYTKARKTLGIALMSLSCYCIYRLFDPQDHHNFSDFWILTTFTLDRKSTRLNSSHNPSSRMPSSA